MFCLLRHVLPKIWRHRGAENGSEHNCSIRSLRRLGSEKARASGLKLVVGKCVVRHMACRLVHRLDRNVSGALVVARTPDAAAWLSHAFRSPAHNAAVPGHRDTPPSAGVCALQYESEHP
jgi:23S rRNA-/tRNA-specific pseudouridylate synthase